MAVGGGSAERKAEELKDIGDDGAGAWAAGAAGERRVAAALSELREAWTVLHDRLLRPGQSEANLDHVVIGPGGLFLVDAKNRAGRVTEFDGGLFQHTVRDGQPVSVSLAVELKKVHGMASYMAAEAGMPVTPVLCLAGAHEAEFGEPRMVRGVSIVPVGRLVDWLNAQPVLLDRESAGRVVTRAMTDFPSTTTHPELLAAIGQAAVAAKSVRRGRAPARRSTAPGSASPHVPGRARPGRRSVGARLGRGFGALLAGLLVVVMALGFLASLPKILASLPGGHPSSASLGSISASGSTVPAPTDCSRVTGAEVASAIKRTVQPITTRNGCAWGTRLDDPATTLVTIQLSANHSAADLELETSLKQAPSGLRHQR
ncbi:nuclease-related domain-containing protein [Nostocoides sp. HKS02]|uniref:nuclease-related domain-containing protein n=1 Tax=Nostocoides sp. HKS02 TaxID=1813880 RepID=UPI0012B4634A|nr:nuclease-related domain-containing protein [Tetrasphaera sp. HKS02]QGN57676.1 hypothetical protein GKE56_07080 [Tetrasphaera sp. HKS02]